tara:strand:+ start:166 stop:384 length:219 start_codon:yes stop_codon:yes gene_type:complete
MRFINSAQIQHRNAIKDSKLAIKEDSRNNVVLSHNETKVSFGEIREDRGRFTVIVTVTSDKAGAKTIILPLS